MLRPEHKRNKNELKSLILNASEAKIDKEDPIIARSILERNLHVAVKPQHSQAPTHEIITNAQFME